MLILSHAGAGDGVGEHLAAGPPAHSVPRSQPGPARCRVYVGRQSRARRGVDLSLQPTAAAQLGAIIAGAAGVSAADESENGTAM